MNASTVVATRRACAARRSPLEGRITAVADVLDALTTTRPYKSGWAFEDAVEFIRQKSGRHFDPDCVQVLLEHTAEFEAIYRQFRNHRD